MGQIWKAPKSKHSDFRHFLLLYFYFQNPGIMCALDVVKATEILLGIELLQAKDGLATKLNPPVQIPNQFGIWTMTVFLLIGCGVASNENFILKKCKCMQWVCHLNCQFNIETSLFNWISGQLLSYLILTLCEITIVDVLLFLIIFNVTI